MEDRHVWVADLGNGRYRNPILYADYSDPDAVRVGDDYFMVSSSFCNTPALPLLHSKDLVSWKVVNYVLDRIPFPDYDIPAHGRGVWAPSIRYHDGKFRVIFPMPDEGIFCCTATDPFGRWSEPFPVREGPGWIDPCPLWDDDGRAYLVNGFAFSRCGIKSTLHLSPMKPDCSGLLGEGKHIFDGHNTQPTIEGPKLYKHNGYYYIFAPAGGVPHGWQTVLRSKNIWGPYDEKIVMSRGNTAVNGPHQGAWVTTQSGEDWFLHFQDVGTCGRIIHLQPMRWLNDWPVIGEDSQNQGIGQPVSSCQKPDVGKKYTPVFPADSDEFDGPGLGLQWQWNANYQKKWYRIGDSRLTLLSQRYSGPLCDMPNLLLQKFPASDFQAVARIDMSRLVPGDLAGLLVLGGLYSCAAVGKTETGIDFVRVTGREKEDEEGKKVLSHAEITGKLYFRLTVRNGSLCRFDYSVDNAGFLPVGDGFETCPGVWVGAKFGLFCIGEREGGALAVDWVRVDPPEREAER